MQFKIESSPFWQTKADVVVAGTFLEEDVAERLKLGVAASNKDVLATLEKFAVTAKDDGFTGKAGQILSLPTYGQLTCKRLFLVGLGKRGSSEASVYRKLAANMARRLATSDKTTSVCFDLRAEEKSEDQTKSPPDHGRVLQSLIEGWILGSFSFQKYKTPVKDEKRSDIKKISFCGWNGDEKLFEQIALTGQTIADATNLARSLIAEPASFMTPTRLADEAKRISAEHGLQCTVIDTAEAKKLGMGSFLGVARGAKEPAKFLAIRYQAPHSKRTIGIIGKGITFDSGGLSLKPAQSMEHMKYDMSGAAAVLGTMQVVGTLKPDVCVFGVIAATENMPGDAALHPGDVLTAMNGKTIEVNNTDAEGRLVLADALTYACKNGADELIDIATLTGAIVTALGRAAAGVMGTDQELIQHLIESGAEAGEKLWQMPLFEEYKESLKSDIADLKNAGARGEAGSSSAGMFLREFVETKPWAHLDIAGPGWLDKDKDECNKGGTAFGVRTLSYYILKAAANGTQPANSSAAKKSK